MPLMQAIRLAVLSVALVAAGARLGPTAGQDATPPGDATPIAPPIVETAAGPVRGMRDSGAVRFLGVPYAASPLEDLRWRSPQPHASWDAVRDATRSGNRCPQPGESPDAPLVGDEDCLVLDVTAPVTASPDAPLPVMVWLHGAGAGVGSGSDFDARRLATDGGVVVVTVNYRLGALGFFGHPGLDGSGGFGLVDQQTALRWVRDNIRAFGGDPGNVTLFGESSGGMDTCAHLTSPTAAGLFDRAIVQSGSCLMELPANAMFPGVPATSIWASPAEAGALGGMLAADVGCASDDPDAALGCLRALPPAELFASPFAAAYGRAAYGNVVIPENPADALRAGRFHRVPVVSGATRDEATFFAAAFTDPPIDAARYAALLDEAFGDDAARIEAVYPLAHFDHPALAWAAVVTDAAWVCPTLEANRLFAAHVPTWSYEFADRDVPALIPSPGFPLGASHGSEVAYLFDVPGFDPVFTPEQRALADAMVRYWSAFAATGDPNAPGLPAWPPFDADADVPFTLALAPGEGGIAPVELGAEHNCGFWDEIGSVLDGPDGESGR